MCPIFGVNLFCNYFCTMRKWIYILLLGFCLFFGQEQVAIDHSAEASSKQELQSLYREQLECAHRHNNFATRTESISVPTTTSTTSVAREQARASATDVAHTTAARAVLSVAYTLYRTSGRRIIDYYLYTLCCLRL